MIVETVNMSPEDAAKLLDASATIGQRRIRRDHLARLVHIINTGQWRETHQPIALNANGQVIDGQHRLTAIAEAGRTVRVSIARDVPDDTLDVIDTGAARSPADVLTMAGHMNTTRLASAARYLLVYGEVVGTVDGFRIHRPNFTSRDILRLANSERGADLARMLRATEPIAREVGRGGIVTWLAPTAIILHESPAAPGDVLAFLQSLRDGVGLDHGSPILALRRYLTSATGLVTVNGSDRAQVGIATTIKAFNSWVAQENRQLVAFRVGIERMPAVVLP